MDTRRLVKTPEEIVIMREAGRMLARVVEALTPLVVVGAQGIEIDAFAEKMIRDMGAVPSFKGYDAGGPIPFPGTICFSRNHEIVHGIPTSEKIIKDGDLVKIDIGLIYDGYHADMARTFMVGNVSEKACALTVTTQKALEQGCAQIKDGATLNDFAQAVEACATKQGYSVVKNLVGHGIGTQLHMPPQIPNYVSREFENFVFRSGMTVALEPMINMGRSDSAIADDGWTFITKDGLLSAHWENTILVTANGIEVLTKV